MQEIIVYIIIAIAVIYGGIRLYRIISGKSKGCNCGCGQDCNCKSKNKDCGDSCSADNK